MTQTHTITIREIPVQVVRKPIKNLHVAVYPPDGRVRVAAPPHISDDNVRLAVISKLGWIKKQRAEFAAQPRQSAREIVSGESHYLWGRRYRLVVEERWGRHEIVAKNSTTLQLFVRPNTALVNRQYALDEWYRGELKALVPALIAKWEPTIGQQVTAWRVQKMKTKWGSCNVSAQRILLNLELAKKPPECLEYIVVHEMVHLLERHHNDTFRAYMDHFLPTWQQARDLLKKAPLAHEDWSY